MDLYVLFERYLLSTILVLRKVLFFFEFWPSPERKLVGRVCFFFAGASLEVFFLQAHL